MVVSVEENQPCILGGFLFRDTPICRTAVWNIVVVPAPGLLFLAAWGVFQDNTWEVKDNPMSQEEAQVAVDNFGGTSWS